MLPNISIGFKDGREIQVNWVQSINFVMGRCVIRAVDRDPISVALSELDTIDLEPVKSRDPL